MPRSTPTATLAAVLATGLCLAPQTAQAHWCDDLWASSYNIVVKPEADTVTAPGLARFKLGSGARPRELGASGLVLPGLRLAARQPAGIASTGTLL